MKTRIDRPWRKTRSHAAALLSALALLGLTMPAASAETGGASAFAASEARMSEGIVFAPPRWAGATWYGPGLYGNRTACGQRLQPQTVGVAHRSLPCGTVVKFSYRGHELVTTVIDRGPFTPGNAWDLTNGARLALDFDGSAPIRYAVQVDFAQGGRRSLNSRRPG
jgi:rare lipoprotein A